MFPGDARSGLQNRLRHKEQEVLCVPEPILPQGHSAELGGCCKQMVCYRASVQE